MKRTLRAQADFNSTILRNQLTSLVLFESITTTGAKGRKLLPFVNHFFNRVKSADLNSKKLAHRTLLDSNAIKKVFEEILPRFDQSETTFVRSLKTMPRRGDAAEMVRMSLIKTLNAKPEEKKVTSSIKEEAKSVKKPVKSKVAKK